MVRIDHILCPVDLSAVSEGALRHAAVMADWYKADLTVLLVAQAKHFASAEHELAAFAAAAVGVGAPRLLVKDGGAVREIVRLASGIPADLVVMGTHGLSGFKRLLLGSVTERVLRESPCPVLTVPPRVVQHAPEPLSLAIVVCAVDFSSSSARALDYAVSVARKAEGRLVVFHALEWFDEEVERPHAGVDTKRLPTSEDDARQELEELLTPDARACDPELVVGYGRPAGEVLRVVRESKAGLIVLGVHGRNALDRTLFGSTTQQVVREAPCPVLTVRA